MIYKPYNYQEFAFQHIIKNPFCGCFLDMGLGKTVITATAIQWLIVDMQIEKALVVAPKQVTRTVWKQECEKWDHLKDLKVSIVWGTPQQRIAALRTHADIYVINRENLVWLVNLFKSKFPFRCVILDEASSFKNHATQRFKHMKMVRPQIKRLIELTGTPAPNSLMDLWAPLYLLDQGERLEKNITGFREKYFSLKNPGEMFSGYRVKKDAKDVIYRKIEDICISMKSEDYLDLPEVIENDIWIDLDEKSQSIYDQLEEELIIEIADKEITALNAAALTTKLRQLANGAIYHEDKSWTGLHDEKLDRMHEIVTESLGQPILCFYQFRHDLEKIQKRFPHARLLKTPQDVIDWNLGKIGLLVAHPASAGHGLNLQAGGHIMIWYGLTFSLEQYLQAIARLARQGQTLPVIIHRLLTRNTVDERLVKAIAEKMAEQDALMEAIRAMKDKWLPGGRVGKSR